MSIKSKFNFLLLLFFGLVLLASCANKSIPTSIPIAKDEYWTPLDLKKIKAPLSPPLFTVPTQKDEATQLQKARESMFTFLQRKRKFPKEFVENGMEHNVIISFVIDENGKIGATEVLSDTPDYLKEECKRIITLMPAWQPAKHGTVAIKSKYVIPIGFYFE